MTKIGEKQKKQRKIRRRRNHILSLLPKLYVKVKTSTIFDMIKSNTFTCFDRSFVCSFVRFFLLYCFQYCSVCFDFFGLHCYVICSMCVYEWVSVHWNTCVKPRLSNEETCLLTYLYRKELFAPKKETVSNANTRTYRYRYTIQSCHIHFISWQKKADTIFTINTKSYSIDSKNPKTSFFPWWRHQQFDKFLWHIHLQFKQIFNVAIDFKILLCFNCVFFNQMII